MECEVGASAFGSHEEDYYKVGVLEHARQQARMGKGPLYQQPEHCYIRQQVLEKAGSVSHARGEVSIESGEEDKATSPHPLAWSLARVQEHRESLRPVTSQEGLRGIIPSTLQLKRFTGMDVSQKCRSGTPRSSQESPPKQQHVQQQQSYGMG
ncbi:hypothetical protein SELMODRAFT_424192 [Selaginella moellendorffii]|uniref:Uncharacterized protein n=1 Tax=Selaginella moellendorffii TaxID=88036 RepID=D8SP40_SELML|nr:hypothetical protein SELMODRAFT_424192 [Selaginella moellendorffii]